MQNEKTESNQDASDAAAANGAAGATPKPASTAETLTPDTANPTTAVDPLAEANARLAEMSDAYLRAKAEAQNTLRRAAEDVSKAHKFAIESFAESLLPVADSLEAGLAITDATPEQIREGAQATLRQLQAALERNKVKAIAPEPGTKFDPALHQAISMVPAEQEANTVVSLLQKGYSIAERTLRPALVTVAAPK
jgi:molecular chaperone GrpE